MESMGAAGALDGGLAVGDDLDVEECEEEL
jgi:hypothetical protein